MIDAIRVAVAERYLQALTARAPRGALLDIRYRRSGRGFGRLFAGADLGRAARTIVELGAWTDVYVGVAPRVRRRGTREDVAATALLWADCDTPEARLALETFTCPPSMIVASGSPDRAHAYWQLTRALDADELEHANRRLASALGADVGCADAARILRPPGTFNFKHDPPRPVELLTRSPTRYDLAAILAALPDLSPPPTPAPIAGPPHAVTAAVTAPRAADPRRAADPLQRIAPADYVRVLTGRTPGHDGKILCPLHSERTPSFHVYPAPAQGWTCFGCPTRHGRPLGGDIYTLAALLWLTGQSVDAPLRGRDFIDVRRRLMAIFFGENPDV